MDFVEPYYAPLILAIGLIVFQNYRNTVVKTVYNCGRYWSKNDKLHRYNGLPAIELIDGSKFWYIDGKRHREGGLPAIELSNGDREWFVNDKRHRQIQLGSEDHLPAVECADGHKEWYVNDKLHRDGGLPAIDNINGNKFWIVDGMYHRDNDLPSVELANGDKQWWINGINITAFREKYKETRRIRAQKRIYFWIIPRLYRPRSESAKRLIEKSWQDTVKLKQLYDSCENTKINLILFI